MGSQRSSRGNETWALPPQRSLPEVVAERIVEAIRSGDLKPGERMVETTLAARLKVSRGPLREALKSLEAVRLLESRRGRGTYVREVSADEFAQMIAVRALLEGLAARLVAVGAAPEQIERLTRLHGRIEVAARGGETVEWRDLDWSFHETICQMSGNDFLLASWRSISNLIRLFLHQHPAYLNDMDGVLANHVAFLEAIRARDPDRAEHVFRATILRSGFSRLAAPIPECLRVYVEPGKRTPAPVRAVPRRKRTR